MPEKEWTTRLQRAVAGQREKDLGGPLTTRTLEAEPTKVTFIGAVTDYVKRLAAAHVDLESDVERLMAERFRPAADVGRGSSPTEAR